MEKEDTQPTIDNPLQYSVGEVCKCYFTEILKNTGGRISQQINKCQSFCRVIAKNTDDVKEYMVEMFDEARSVKKLPGRCLRKVKLQPFTYEQSKELLGQVIETNTTYDDRKISMVVSVVDEANGNVEINSISTEDMMNFFHFKSTGAPVCNIVMLKADEAFQGSSDED